MARATRSEQTGSIGVSEATGKFGRIGFGFAEITRHDNGTDVFLMARDARLFDLGLTMGAQIKGGAYWFNEPESDDHGNVLGWWFRDADGSHIDDWLRHGLPHLLVLHNLEADVTYWVHVTHEAVISTGKGKKILVPANQRVDAESLNTLISIAASSRPAPHWEGSAWRGAESVLERDLLRYALLVPRLVAPHPNAPKGAPLGAAQSTAMVMQARLSELDALQEQGLVPSVEKAIEHDEWMWRFYAALHRRVTTGDVDHLLEINDAPTPATAAAAAVTAAACMMEEDRYEEAAEVLKEAIKADTAEPVDHAWISVQLARAYAEVGNLEESRRLAGSVLDIAATHSLDVTATAIAGAGVQLLFGLDWASGTANSTGSVGKTIEAADTAASWWRQQTRGWALGDALDRTFRAWTRAKEFRWSSTDPANDHLVAASLNASLAGAQAEWRQLTGLLGKDKLVRLDRKATSEEASDGLSLLRLSGQVKALEQAARRLTWDGPAAAVADVARKISLDSVSHTSAQSTLTLLRIGGAVLDQDVADSTVYWLLSTLKEQTAFVERVRPNFLLQHTLVETLAAVLESASQPAHRVVIDHLVQMPAVSEQLLANSWTSVIKNLSEKAWDTETTAKAAALADGCEETLRHALWGAASTHVEAAREFLLHAIREGSDSALSMWSDVRTLPPETVQEAVGHLVDHLAIRREQAVDGAITHGGYDHPRSLSILNRHHPDQAQWEPLIKYLEDHNVVSDEKAGAVTSLAWMGKEHIPNEFHERLIAAAEGIIHNDKDRQEMPFDEMIAGATGEAIFLKYCLSDDLKMDGTFLQTLAGDDRQRKWAAETASKQAGAFSDPWTGVLVTLAYDSNHAVRAKAAMGLASLITNGTSPNSIAVAVVESLLDDGGLLVPLRIAQRLASEPLLPTEGQQILTRLQSHRLHCVRREVKDADPE